MRCLHVSLPQGAVKHSKVELRYLSNCSDINFDLLK